MNVKIGLIRERKNPPDRRVAFVPEQCSSIQNAYPGIQFSIEPSDVRCVPDEMYMASGLEVSEDMEGCQILFGIKEVPVWALFPEKTYFIFSHTIKKQAHNRPLLLEILAKKITLVDYECLVDESGNRTVAFGRFAGIVGAYNAFRMWMFRYHGIRLKAASECGDMEEMLDYASHHTSVLAPVKIAVTGTGRVGKGAVEVLENLGIRQVTPEEYLKKKFNEPVFTCLSSRHYFHKPGTENWVEADFREHPENYDSHFSHFSSSTDILITCHYWDPRAPALFSREETSADDFKIRVISDVTCDLNGSVPSTVRTSTIDNPFYDIDPVTFSEKPAFSGSNNLTICAVDNLPCELPLDSSIAFGEMLKETVIPEIHTGKSPSIERATIARNGSLTPRFQYLEDYVNGK